MGQMSPELERLVRLIVLLPTDDDSVNGGGELWDSLWEDSSPGANQLRWYVGYAVRAPTPDNARRLAGWVLEVFGASLSDKTLRLIAKAAARHGGVSEVGSRVGECWVSQVTAAAIEVLAYASSLDTVLDKVEENWTRGRQ